MDNDVIYCPNCGAKNSIESEFCYNCGTKLSQFTQQSVKEERLNSTNASKNKAQKAEENRSAIIGAIIVGTLLIIAIIGNIGQKYYIKHQNNEIRSCVYEKLGKNDFSVHINHEDKIINITPSATQGALILSDSDEDLNEYETSVLYISERIESKVGKGWTINVENPFNKKRTFWLVKDGKIKYSLSNYDY